MGSNRSLYLTTWMPSSHPILESVIEIVDLLSVNTSWIDPKTRNDDLAYTFISMRMEGHQKSVRFNRKARKDLEYARSEINVKKPVAIKVSLLGNWLDPYVIGEDFYRNWIIYLEVSSTQSEQDLKVVKLQFGYCTRWFTLLEQSDELFHETGIVRETVNKGFKLNKGEYVSPKTGQSYVAQEEILQKNRISILDGTASLISGLNSKTLVLAHDLSVYDANQNLLAFQHGPDIQFPPPFYYGDSSIRNAIEAYEKKGFKYFEYSIKNHVLSLEESHYGFLVEEL
jgi:hypothetical protein